jgi:hypothetical protein
VLPDNSRHICAAARFSRKQGQFGQRVPVDRNVSQHVVRTIVTLSFAFGIMAFVASNLQF